MRRRSRSLARLGRRTGLAGWIFLVLIAALGFAVLAGAGFAQEAAKDGQHLADVAAKTKAMRESGINSTPGQRAMSAVALVTFLGIGYVCSWNRSKIDWKLVTWGVGLQFLFAFLILKTDPGKLVFSKLNDFFTGLIGYTTAGSGFLFGSLTNPGGPAGPVFAFFVLPSVIFFSSLMAVCYYLGLVQPLVLAMAKVMYLTMGVSGAEALSASANIFVGQTEAPLVVKPFVSRMTVSEIHALMCGGMATIAGGVMAAYVQMGVSAGHLLSASVMSAPASLVFAKMLVPEDGEPETRGKLEMKMDQLDANVIDAAARGATEGLQLALNVAAMLLAFIALIAMVNGIFGYVHGLVGVGPKSLEQLAGWVFYPTAWILGVRAEDTEFLGQLFGIKTILNEFVAYDMLAKNLDKLDPRSSVLATYVLCGFANFSSIAIQIGGLGTIAPNRRPDLAKLGIWSLLGGTLACYMTAAVAGIVL